MPRTVLFSREGIELTIARKRNGSVAILTMEVSGEISIARELKGKELEAFYQATRYLLPSSEELLETSTLKGAVIEAAHYLKQKNISVDDFLEVYRKLPFFNEDTSNIIGDKRLDDKKIRAEVFIGLPQKEIDLFTIERIQNATGDFMEAMGFELETKDEPVFGSFFQEIIYFFKGAGKQEVREVYDKGKKALEIQYLNLPAAEATSKYVESTAALISALQGVDEAALRLGGILLIKVRKDGVPRILAETVSPELSLLLDKNPQLLENPQALFGMLAALQTTSKRIEEEGATEAIEVE